MYHLSSESNFELENSTAWSNDTNCGETTDHEQAYDIVFYCSYLSGIFLLSIISIIGNSLVIHAMLKHSQLRLPGNYFILSLACSDLLLGLVYPVYNIGHIEAPLIRDSMGDWHYCTVIITLTMGLLFVSSYNLVGITATRYLSIRDPLSFPRRMTHKRALTAVLLVWVTLLGLAVGLYLRPNPPDHYSHICRYELVLSIGHITFLTFFYVLCPLVVMAVLYGHMTCIARKQIRAIVDQEVCSRRYSEEVARRMLIKRELKMFRMAGTLLAYFTFAWTPFVIFEFYIISGGNEETTNRWVRAMVRMILHSNTTVNVIVYAGRLKEFRDYIRQDLRLFPCCKGAERNPQNSVQLHIQHANNNTTGNGDPMEPATSCLCTNVNTETEAVRNLAPNVGQMPSSRRYRSSQFVVIETNISESENLMDNYEILLIGQTLPAISIYTVSKEDESIELNRPPQPNLDCRKEITQMDFLKIDKTVDYLFETTLPSCNKFEMESKKCIRGNEVI